MEESLPGERVSSTILALESNITACSYPRQLPRLGSPLVRRSRRHELDDRRLDRFDFLEGRRVALRQPAGRCDTSAMDGLPVAEYPTVLLLAADAAATIGRPPRSHALISFPFLMC